MLPGKASNKSVKRIDRPRPLKGMNENFSSTGSHNVTEGFPVSDDVLVELENLVKILNNSVLDSSFPGNVQRSCRNLKGFGRGVEHNNTAQLDRYFVFLRNAARDERFDPMTRLHLLEIIELRASGWKGSDNVEHYYKSRLQDTENVDPSLEMTIPMSPLSTSSSMSSFPTGSLSGVPMPPVSSNVYPGGLTLLNQPQPQPPPAVSVLGVGEILKTSGKYPRPTKIPAKNYFKDEIVIRNSDSGKVMPGAKDRLVQITGPAEDSIGNAKQLIEDTIRRNVSPIRELPSSIQTSESSPNLASMLQSVCDEVSGVGIGGGRPTLMHSLSMNDASIGEYQYTVNTGCGTISLSGKQFDLIRTAKLVLEEYFAGDAKRTIHECIDEEDMFESNNDNCYDHDYRLRALELPELMPPPSPRTPPPFGHSSAFHSPPPSLQQQPPPLLSRNNNNNNGHLLTSTSLTTSVVSSVSTPSVFRLQSLGKGTSSRLGDSGRGVVTTTTMTTTGSRDSSLDNSDEDDESDDDLAGVSLDRRAVVPSVAQLKVTSPPTTATTTITTSAAPVYAPRKVYTRHYLLRCSESVYSRVQPKDISRIVLDNPTIHKKFPEVFDPTEYYEARLPSNAVMSCNSALSSVGSLGGSQDGVEEKDD